MSRIRRAAAGGVLGAILLASAVGCGGGESTAGDSVDSVESASEEYPSTPDPLEEQFESDWSNLSSTAKDGLCYGTESMTPAQMTDFIEAMNPNLDSYAVAMYSQWISEKCTEGGG